MSDISFWKVHQYDMRALYWLIIPGILSNVLLFDMKTLSEINSISDI